MNKIGLISLGLSVFLHSSLVAVMGGGHGWMGRLIPPMPIKQKDITLEFVDTPESAPESKIQTASKVISDKTVTAKDNIKEVVKEKHTRSQKTLKGKQLAKSTDQGAKNTPEQLMPPKEEVQKKEPQPQTEIVSQPQKIEQKTEQEKPVNEKIIPPQSLPQKQMPKAEYDVINIPEISESIFSAPEEGPVAFETQAHKIGPYFKQIKQKIGKYWLSYLVFKYQNTAPIASETVVSFKILPGGEVSSVKVLEYSGDSLFRDFCVASVMNTAPYPPLPDNIKDEYTKNGGLDIVFTFRYQ